MEGSTIGSSRLRFIEAKDKIRVTSSPQICNPSYKLITAANNHQLILVGLSDATIRSVRLNDPSRMMDAPVLFRTLAAPRLLTVARYGFSSILLVTSNHNNCPLIEVFDLDNNQKLADLQIPELTGSDIVDYAWHPNYYDSLVALCTGSGNLLVVAISRMNRALSLVYNKHYDTLSCCWSPKGKNLAIGTSNGQIIRLEPVISTNSFNFKEVDKSTLVFSHPKMTTEHRVIKLIWVNKTYLLSVHARLNHPGGTESIYTIFTVKPSKPYKYWTNVCYENIVSPNYVTHLMNLTNAVICTSNTSCEAAVIGFDGSREATTGDLKDCYNISVDEGARIEFPLDDQNRETYPLGATIVESGFPKLVYYTTDGRLCIYDVSHSENILKIPEFQPEQPLPLVIEPKPSDLTNDSSMSLNLGLNLSLSAAAIQPQPQPQTQTQTQTQTQPAPQPQQQNVTTQPKTSATLVLRPKPSINVEHEIAKIKEKMSLHEEYFSLLGEINQMRTKLDEVAESHQSIRDTLTFFDEDIQQLEVSVLENYYLIEYAKMREKSSSRKRSIDPITSKKVEAVRKQARTVADQLRDLEVTVEVAWEDFVVCQKRTPMNKSSLDIIYKNLAMNQRIINLLKKRVPENIVKSPAAVMEQDFPTVSSRKELDPARMLAFKKFLSSRNVAPIRRPE